MYKIRGSHPNKHVHGKPSATIYNLNPPLIAITVNQQTISQCFLYRSLFFLYLHFSPTLTLMFFFKSIEFPVSFQTFYLDVAALRVESKLRTITLQPLP